MIVVNLRRVRMSDHTESWIPIPDTDNRYICSSLGRVSVYDSSRNQYRALSGVYSMSGLHYYWIIKNHMKIRFYEKQALELFTKPHPEPEYYESSLKVKNTQIIQKFLSGVKLKILCEEYDMPHSALSRFLKNEVGETVYQSIITQNRRETARQIPHTRRKQTHITSEEEEEILSLFLDKRYSISRICEESKRDMRTVRKILKRNLSKEDFINQVHINRYNHQGDLSHFFEKGDDYE